MVMGTEEMTIFNLLRRRYDFKQPENPVISSVPVTMTTPNDQHSRPPDAMVAG
jgi:hypothetical protein